MSKSRKKDDKPKEDEGPSILQRLVEEQQKRAEQEEYSNDVAILFVGSSKSGKTSLIDRFINPSKDEKDQPKATNALDYKFARYASDTSTSKVLAHIYDLGGDEAFNELSAIPVSGAAVGNLVVAIVVDLSEPHNILSNLDKWLQLLRQQVTASLEELRKMPGGGQRVDTIQRSQKECYNEHPDQQLVNPFPVPLVIFGTKCDTLFTEVDPEKRKTLTLALRFFAHMNGASLVFTALKDKSAMNAMRAVLRFLLFGVVAKGGVPEQLDISKPIAVGAGKDNFQGIGAPQGGTGEQAWRHTISGLFPDVTGGAKGSNQKDGDPIADEILRYPETSIDGMVEQRLEELQQYRRQVERNQRFASVGMEGANKGVYAS